MKRLASLNLPRLGRDPNRSSAAPPASAAAVAPVLRRRWFKVVYYAMHVVFSLALSLRHTADCVAQAAPGALQTALVLVVWANTIWAAALCVMAALQAPFYVHHTVFLEFLYQVGSFQLVHLLRALVHPGVSDSYVTIVFPAFFQSFLGHDLAACIGGGVVVLPLYAFCDWRSASLQCGLPFPEEAVPFQDYALRLASLILMHVTSIVVAHVTFSGKGTTDQQHAQQQQHHLLLQMSTDSVLQQPRPLSSTSNSGLLLPSTEPAVRHPSPLQHSQSAPAMTHSPALMSATPGLIHRVARSIFVKPGKMVQQALQHLELRLLRSLQGTRICNIAIVLVSGLAVSQGTLHASYNLAVYGPHATAAEARFSPIYVIVMLMATWVLSSVDLNLDADVLALSVGGRLRAQQKQHWAALEEKERLNRQLQLDTVLMKDRAEAALRQLAEEQLHLTTLQGENNRLLQQQEVLQAELQLALHNYQPTTVIDAGTPADKILGMVTDLLDGVVPDIETILFVQSAILSSRDIFRPVDLGKQMQASSLDDDVSAALMAQLARGDDARAAAVPAPVEYDAADYARNPSPSRSTSLLGEDDGDFGTLSGALHAIMAARESLTHDALGAMAGRHRQVTSEGSVVASSRGPSMDLRHAASAAPPPPDGPCAHSTASASARLHKAVMKHNARTGSGTRLAFPPGPAASAAAAANSSASNTGAVNSGTTTALNSLRDFAVAPGSVSLNEAAGSAVAATVVGSTRAGSNTDSSASANSGIGQALTTCNAPSVMTDSFFDIVLPSPPLFDEVERVLLTANGWLFDAFQLCEVTKNHPLSTLAYFLMHEAGLISRFNIKGATLARFLRRIEAGYPDSNPYHNRTHAANVTQVMHVILCKSGVIPGYVDALTHMACILTAVVHDFEHVGLTNDFLITTGDKLALRYNDRSPQENHHLAATFNVLRMPEFNFLGHLPKADFERFRRTTIELVLATDMKQHFAITSQFNTVHRLNAVSASLKRRPSMDSMGSASSPVCGGTFGGTFISGAGDELRAMLPLDESERILSLQMALKCADLGHMSAYLPVHLRWVDCLEQEMFNQGDREKAAGLTVSPLFDRDKPGVTKSQVGFYDIVCIPLFLNFSHVFGGCKPLLTYAMRNYAHWSDLQQQAAQHAQQEAAADAAADLEAEDPTEHVSCEDAVAEVEAVKYKDRKADEIGT